MSGKKKLLAALLCLILAGACCLAAPAFAESEIYIEYAWDNDTEELTRAEKPIPEGAAQLDAETTGLAYNEENQGWFTAGGALTFDTRLTVTGDVRLILLDGCKLRANQGITVEGSSSLTIYAQSEDENTGALAAAGSANNAAIGGGNQGSGTITIHGGKIDATTVGYGAGIGGGCYGSGEVTIFGGTVSATTGGYGAAIGGGIFGGGTIAIHGGAVTVSVTNKDSICAGIGGGAGGSGAVTITGGTVTAAASGFAAAIGAGNDGSGSAISLSWTKAGDSITADSYRGTVELKKNFEADNTGYEVGVVSNNDILAGRTLRPPVVKRRITVISTGDGTVTADLERAITGDSITLTLTPGEGNVPGSLTYTPDGGAARAIPFNRNADGTYTGSFTMPAANVTVNAAFVIPHYILYARDNETEPFLPRKKLCRTAIALGPETTVLERTPENEGWYAASGSLIFGSRLKVIGDVHLILLDGCEITANSGIDVSGEGSSLTIYAQSEGKAMGKITAMPGDRFQAAIGGDNEYSGTVTIHSGNVTAITGELNDGAGIGGGNSGSGTVTIYGGNVTAITGELNCGAGIGGGDGGSGTVTIYGGNVTAITGENSFGAGIGGGNGNSDSVTIYGGNVTAITGENSSGAGIGGGNGNSDSVTIHGGVVTASSAGSGAAIGGSFNISGKVTINGGKVNAISYSHGAAIGGGLFASGEVMINGGTVSATTSGNVAAIGNGHFGNGSEISLSWMKAGDSVTSDSYGGTVTLEKDFTDGTTIFDSGEVSDNNELDKKTLCPPDRRRIAVAGTEHGVVSADPEYAFKDETVTITLKPADGYMPASLTYKTDTGEPQPVDFTLNDAGTYTGSFTMPDADVTVIAAFSEIPPFDAEHVNFTLPSSCTEIGANAFANDGTIAIVDASHCTFIGDSAFKNCTGLAQILLPADCEFSASAFEGCEALIAIYAPGPGTTQQNAKASSIPFGLAE